MSLIVEVVVGVLLAAGLIAIVWKLRINKSALILGASLFVAALIYVGFALFGLYAATADSSWLIFELGGLVFYSVFAFLGIRSSVLYLAAGWGLHVMWDLSFHSTAEFVPAFYPAICVGFDAAIALFALYLVTKRSEN